jgi:chemotaxis protein MotB
MFAIIGIVVVFGAVLAGYLMEHGNVMVLMQPAELIIILGAAIGTVLVANPLHILTAIGKGIGAAFGGSPFTKQRYASSQVDKRKAGRLAQAIQVAFQELGVFQTSNTKVPLEDDDAMPFEKVQAVENLDRKADLARIVNPMKGTLTSSAETQSLLDAQQAIQNVLDPEIQKHEVTMSMRRDGLVVSLKEMGFFESGSATIRPDSMDALSRLAKVLKQRQENIRIEGHTDNIRIHNAHFASNWELSTTRATEIIRLLITQFGLPPSRLSAAGYAEFHPTATNDTAAGRAQNRRLDIVILTPLQAMNDDAQSSTQKIRPAPSPPVSPAVGP